MKQSLLLLGTSLLLSAAFSQAADASFYTNSSRKTQLVLDTSGEQVSGYYFTQIQGRDWYGDFNIQQRQHQRGIAEYHGTFSDSLVDDSMTCTGNISIYKLDNWINQPADIRVNWQITSGQGCPTVNQSFEVTLTEPFPSPDASGNYTAQNANVVWTGTSSNTWKSWQVVSADGSLNCRSTPNGEIRHVYQTGARIEALSDRSSSAFYQVSQPWLRTTDQCYVRANSQYIQPISTREQE